MALYKRKGSPYWYLKLAVRGLRFQGTTGTTDENAAELFAERKRRELWDEVQLGKKPDRSWQDAKRRYLEERGHIASHETDAVHFAYLEGFIGDKRLSEIDRACLDRIVSAGRRENVKNATINRRLELVRRVLRRARDEWEWELRVAKIPTLDEPRVRERYLRPEEAERL